MAAADTDHKWSWEADKAGNRHWYKHSYTRNWPSYGGSFSIAAKHMSFVRGTVTRVTDTKSEHFNRWFAQLHTPPIKSEPLLTKEAAKAWLEVIERMNR
jgi:hypothetical protein